ncbi:MAG: ABC transporter permease [Candidatus Latescibacterota bacterium]
MLRNYLVIGLRHLARQGRYTVFSLFGLTLGVASCLLMCLSVDHELRFDAFHEKGDRIYRVLLSVPASSPRPTALFPAELVGAVARDVQGVRASAGFLTSTARIAAGHVVFDEEAVALATPDFLAIFTFPLLHGDTATALRRPDAVVLTARAADRLFGLAGHDAVRVLGQILQAGDRPFVVTGVAADLPSTSSLQFDYLFNLEAAAGFQHSYRQHRFRVRVRGARGAGGSGRGRVRPHAPGARAPGRRSAVDVEPVLQRGVDGRLQAAAAAALVAAPRPWCAQLPRPGG